MKHTRKKTRIEMKLLFVDLDDTLLTSKKDISRGDMDAICEMINRGHKVILNSGRPLLSMKWLAEKFGFMREGFYISSFNGALIYDCVSDKELFFKPLDENISRFIFDRAHEAGIHIHTYNATTVVAEADTPELDFYVNRISMKKLVVDDFMTVTNGKTPKVVLVSLDNKQKLIDFRDKYEDTLKGKVYTTFSDDRLLEYAHIETNKGSAIRFFSEYLNVPIKDTIAAGDQENDIPMLIAAGVGVCMKNGRDEVKSVADYITENTNDEDGIKEIIEKFIL